MVRDDVIDSTVIISVRFVGEKDDERFETYIGRVNRIESKEKYESLEDETSVESMFVECHDGEVREYPFDPDVFEPADPGFYELNDGATIENPDYILEWRVTEPVKH